MLAISNFSNNNSQQGWKPSRAYKNKKPSEISSANTCNSTLIMNRPDNSLFYRSPKHINGNKFLGLLEKISLGRVYIAGLTSRAIPFKNRKVDFITDFKPDSFLSKSVTTLTIIGHGANHKEYKEAMAKLSVPEQLNADDEEVLNNEVSQYVSFYSPQTLADILFSGGLRSVQHLKLIGCKMGNSSNQYIDQLALELHKKNICFSKISATKNLVVSVFPVWTFSLGSFSLKYRTTTIPD
ncbi:hypothetical protein [Endozoicomonas ascidiicola]|uniref:hypothetical protein n=1 Tax=Endozoicomonas ascidiicola TaxID=1698521 RepID=UPI00083780D3|nr:hypothetical protein [Endozoicomonas ascidiicola]